ncbi:hypothetical protein L484_014102 [Morus notabilis]|uniref:Uncharacterized protein n=1 Tax=Morus notabilis TaxID=981085 RepID=W9RBZ0_9ROSA|nr:hypothetical protein L484_014102 [Morus notabilis]
MTEVVEAPPELVDNEHPVSTFLSVLTITGSSDSPKMCELAKPSSSYEHQSYLIIRHERVK